MSDAALSCLIDSRKPRSKGLFYGSAVVRGCNDLLQIPQENDTSPLALRMPLAVDRFPRGVAAARNLICILPFKYV